MQSKTIDLRNVDNKIFFKNFLKIIDKSSKQIPFVLNTAQERLNNTILELQNKKKPVRIIILKARQMGFSTFTEGLGFKTAIFNPNTKVGIITHSDSATTNLFNMTKNFYTKMPEPRPQVLASNAKELIFNNKEMNGLNSKIKCMTAGASGVGRSDTFNYLHISEYAFWEGDKVNTLRGLLQAVPDTPESVVIIESTANGYEEYKEMWDNAVSGKSDYVPVFFAWFEEPKYRKPYYGFKLTEEEEELKDRYTLDNEQIAWRRWCIKNNCNGDVEYFHQEYPSNPMEAFISTGQSVFDKEKIIKRIEQLKNIEPIKTGYFDYSYDGTSINDIRFVEDKKGCIKLYIDRINGHPYVLGGDTAGDGSDYFTGQMIDNTTGNQVAVLRMQTDEDLYAQQIYCLGKYYNNALLGLEVNFSTFPVKELQRLEYENIYIRTQEDTFTNRTLKSYGFRTTTKTRPIILADLIRIVRDDINSFNDIETLKEMLTFVRNKDKNMKMEAMFGYHDDLIMAMAITFYIRDQQDYIVNEEKFVESDCIEQFIKSFNKEDGEYEERGFLEWDSW